MRWLFLLGGPLVWTIHLFGVYSLASLAEVADWFESERFSIAILTVVAAAANGALLFISTRTHPIGFLDGLRPSEERFWRTAAGSGAFVSLVAVLWQGLPAVLRL